MKHPSDIARLGGLNPGAKDLWPTALPVRPRRRGQGLDITHIGTVRSHWETDKLGRGRQRLQKTMEALTSSGSKH